MSLAGNSLWCHRRLTYSCLIEQNRSSRDRCALCSLLTESVFCRYLENNACTEKVSCRPSWHFDFISHGRVRRTVVIHFPGFLTHDCLIFHGYSPETLQKSKDHQVSGIMCLQIKIPDTGSFRVMRALRS